MSVVGPHGSQVFNKLSKTSRFIADVGFLDLVLPAVGPYILDPTADVFVNLSNSNKVVVNTGGAVNTGRTKL